HISLLMSSPPPTSPPFPYTTLFRSLLLPPAALQVTARDDQLVADRRRHRDDLARRRDDRRLTEQVAAFLASGLGHADDPRGVLIGAGLHGEMVVEAREVILLGRRRVVDRRVVAQQHQLDALQPHHPVGLGPAAVVADAHADDGAAVPRDGPAEIAHLEVALLEVLERAPRLVLGVAGQVDLAVLEDAAAARVDEERRVVAMAIGRLLRVAEAEAEAEPPRLVEERLRFRPGHLGLEEGVDLGLILHPPARKERRQRELGEHDQLRAARLRLVQQREQALDDVGATVGALDRPELCRGHDHDAAHSLAERRAPEPCEGAPTANKRQRTRSLISRCSRGASRRTPGARGRSCETRPAPRTGPTARTAPRRRRSSDRKSTRLNSSHVSISYAVF